MPGKRRFIANPTTGVVGLKKVKLTVLPVGTQTPVINSQADNRRKVLNVRSQAKVQTIANLKSTTLPPVEGTRYSLRPRLPRPPVPETRVRTPFNTSFRAAPPRPGTKIYYDESRPSLEKLADKLKIQGIPLPTNKLAKAAPSPGKTFTRTAENYKLSEMAAGPRTPPRGAKTFVVRSLLDPVSDNVKKQHLEIMKRRPVVPRRANLRTVMKGYSAREHAESVRPEFAQARWEWLHLGARSLGGSNTMDNLVAGTYDANTKMLPVEQQVARQRLRLQGNEVISYRVQAELLPGSHVASKIRISAMFPSRLNVGSIFVEVNPLDNTKFTRSQYELSRFDLSHP